MIRRLRLLLAIEISHLWEHRRIWLVAMLAPLILMPLAHLVLAQLNQLGQAHRSASAQVGVVGLPAPLIERLQQVRNTNEGEDAAQDNLVRITGPDAVKLVTQLEALTHAQIKNNGEDGIREPAKEAPQRAEICRELRRLNCVAAVVGMAQEPGRAFRLIVAVDNGQAEADTVLQDLNEGLDGYVNQVRVERLARVGLDESLLEVLKDHCALVATPESSLRIAMAGALAIFVVALVLLATLPMVGLLAGRGSVKEEGMLPDTVRAWVVIRTLVAASVTALVAASLLATIAAAVALCGACLALGQDPEVLARFAFAALPPALAIVPALVALFTAGMIAVRSLLNDGHALNAYVVPLMLVMLGLALPAIAGPLGPGWVTDAIPVTGPVLVLKAALQGSMPWSHLAMTTIIHAVIAGLLTVWIAHHVTRAAGEGLAPMQESLAVFALAELAFIAASPLFEHLAEPWQITGPLVMGLLAVVAIHALVRRLDLRRVWYLTWPRAAWWPQTIMAAPWLIMLGCAIGALQPEVPDTIDTGVEIIHSVGQEYWLIALACTALAPAICEELLCRGVVLSGLRRSLGPVAAVLISSLLFALMHGSPWRFLPQAAVGVVLAVLTLRSASILPAMLLHASYNAGLWVLDQQGAWLLTHVPWAQTLAAADPRFLLVAGFFGTSAAVGFGRAQER